MIAIVFQRKLDVFLTCNPLRSSRLLKDRVVQFKVSVSDRLGTLLTRSAPDLCYETLHASSASAHRLLRPVARWDKIGRFRCASYALQGNDEPNDSNKCFRPFRVRISWLQICYGGVHCHLRSVASLLEEIGRAPVAARFWLCFPCFNIPQHWDHHKLQMRPGASCILEVTDSIRHGHIGMPPPWAHLGT